MTSYLFNAVLVLAIVTTLIVCINFIILQLSARSNLAVVPLNLFYFFINKGILLAAIGIVYCICGKLWIASAVCSLICIIYSIVNQYVIEFHGSPLTIPEFSNTKTEINVLNNYSFLNIKVMIFVALIGVLSTLLIVLIIKQYRIEQEKNTKERLFFK